MRNIFWGNPDEKKESPVKTQTEKTATVSPQLPKPSTPSNNDYAKDIWDFLEKCNIPGPDFMEFRKAVEAPGMVMLTDPQKYTSVYAAFAAMNINDSKLTETGKFYLTKIQERRQLFIQSMDNARKKYITDKQSIVSQLEQENNELTKRIQENVVKMGNLNSDVAADTLRLNGEEQAFNQQATLQETIITNHINNIKTYLHATTTSQ